MVEDGAHASLVVRPASKEDRSFSMLSLSVVHTEVYQLSIIVVTDAGA